MSKVIYVWSHCIKDIPNSYIQKDSVSDCYIIDDLRSFNLMYRQNYASFEEIDFGGIKDWQNPYWVYFWIAE